MNITEEVIKHLSKNIKTKIGVSAIDGVGVFAIRDINAGENVFPIWEGESFMYVIPNEKLSDIPNEVLELLDMYFINDECGFKIIRLFKGMNFLFHGTSYCNSAWPNKKDTNIDITGFAIRDIKAGEEILEWYNENINLENSK
jgi:SET domain-containing protein